MGERSNDRGRTTDGCDGRPLRSEGKCHGSASEQSAGAQRGESSRGVDGASTESDLEAASRTEKAIMIVSALFTVGLFAFVAWNAVTGATGSTAPEATVIGTTTAPNGDVIATVELRNPGDVGLISATASVSCGDPPPELEFQMVPAGGRPTGSVVCPAGTTDPTATVSNWIPR